MAFNFHVPQPPNQQYSIPTDAYRINESINLFPEELKEFPLPVTAFKRYG